MSTSLSEIQIISELAKHIYSFLPGTPHPLANKSISFAGAAKDLGLTKFWVGGSKLPAITTLLESTLTHARDKFCPLVVQIVQRALKYRASNPITREEIEQLNGIIRKLDFKIPELWNPDFLRSLPSKHKKETDSVDGISRNALNQLLDDLIKLKILSPQERGYEFEKFLNKFFDAFDMEPRTPFRLKGEQIDGSIECDKNIYLVEARWQNHQVGSSELLVLHGKVRGKATWSRGIFISYSGFTTDGLGAFASGRPTNLICVSGQDLYFVLDGGMPLDKVLSIKSRLAAEENRPYVPVQELVIENYKFKKKNAS